MNEIWRESHLCTYTLYKETHNEDMNHMNGKTNFEFRFFIKNLFGFKSKLLCLQTLCLLIGTEIPIGI